MEGQTKVTCRVASRAKTLEVENQLIQTRIYPAHLIRSQISVISLTAVSAPSEKSVPGTLFEIVAGSTTCGQNKGQVESG